VFRNDNTGTPSLEAVRLLNRMIKERHYDVHPRVLFCLLHLRLKTELVNVRASKEHVDKAGKHSESKAKLKRAKGKGNAVMLPHLSKKAKKALKESKVIQAELHEAEAEVDREELASQVCAVLLPYLTAHSVN
jgi:nucleolar complex protein 3